MDWSNLLQSILEAILPILATALTGWLVAQTRLAWGKFEDNKPDLAWTLEEAARMAVKAAEQLGLNDAIDDKLSYAVDIVERYLQTKKLNVDIELILAAIEKAVLESFPKE